MCGSLGGSGLGLNPLPTFDINQFYPDVDPWINPFVCPASHLCDFRADAYMHVTVLDHELGGRRICHGPDYYCPLVHERLEHRLLADQLVSLVYYENHATD